MRKLLSLIIVIVGLTAALFCLASPSNVRAEDTTTTEDTEEPNPGYNLDDLIKDLFRYKFYNTYLEEHAGAPSPNDVININIFDYEVEDMDIDAYEDYIVTDEKGTITWTFQVSNPGFYNLKLTYYPVLGRSSDIQREIYIDGEIPFDGLDQVEFSRIWIDNEGIIKKGNHEVRTDQVEQPAWQTVYISDSQKYVQGPFKIYLAEGQHTLSFKSIAEPMAISAISFEQAPEVPSYQDYIKELIDRYPVYNGKNIKFQAERIGGDNNALVGLKKSSPMLYPISNFSNSRVEPYHPYEIRLNTIGGTNWRIIGDWITWEFEVPQDGLYTINFNAIQNASRGSFSVRELRVNGEVPFQEAYDITINYDTEFQMYTIGGNEPYLFYLKKGVNSITLEVALGKMGPLIQEVRVSVMILNDLYRKITKITGVTPKDYIDYQLEEKLPQMIPTFIQERDRLARIVRDIKTIAGDTSDKTALLDQMVAQLNDLIKKPEKIINQLYRFQSNISAMSTWILQVSEQPLEIDYFIIAGPNSKLPKVRPNIFETIYYNIFRLISTFFVDYNNFVSDGTNNPRNGNSVEVWIQSGRDQAQILRNLIDNSFTPKTGISVNLKLVPGGVILPATFAGNGPDVVLGIGGDTVVNFAMRDALQDLTEFSDFNVVKQQFVEEAFMQSSYQGGVYGLPETQSFFMLFYREDILNELGLKVPETWEEVYDMIPILEMNNYEFYIPSNLQMYATILYQLGGTMYLGEGNDLGIESGLTSEEAMRAFEIWTDFYTSYKLAIEANFANRFRTGEMPIGIADYTTYNTFQVFAPEISGLWGFAPLPGFRQEDGSINNASISGVSSTIMLKSAKNKEASWEFMKWWVSADTQVNYGRSLEAIMGAAARYNTANLEAVGRLPWASKDYEMLMKQFQNVKVIPEVPGGYITGRHVDYALKAVVNSGTNPRESLYENVKYINDELTKKRQEFNLTYREEGNK